MSQQEQFQSDNRSTSEVEKESLDLIEKILKSNGYIVNDKGLNIEFAALKEIRNWVEQDDKTTQLNWDKVENCFAIMLNEYLDKTNDLKSKIGDCSDRRKSLIEKNINLEVEAVRPILNDVSSSIVEKEQNNEQLGATINETIKYVRKGFEKIDNSTNSKIYNFSNEQKFHSTIIGETT